MNKPVEKEQKPTTHYSTSSCLIFKEGTQVQVKFIKEKAYSIGRSHSADIALKSIDISRYHASVYVKDRKCWILDGDLEGNPSTNGLLINGKRKHSHKLRSGDIIAFCPDAYAMFLSMEDIVKMSPSALSALKILVNFLSDRYTLKHKRFDRTFARGKGAKDSTYSGFDDLTKLPNKSAFLDRINQLLLFKEHIKENHQFAVLFIDLDRFKLINDSLGHLAGDQLLIQISERMKSCLRPKDMLARLGGDEFAILINNIQDCNEAVAVARRLLENLEKPLWIDQNEIFPGASIGIASSEVGYKCPEDILRDADTAMYQAKSGGRGRLEVFDETMRQKAIELLKLDADLKRATTNQEFRLYYQPIVSLKEKRLVGFEALIRWLHPEKGLIGPHEFIQFLEDKNLIYQVGQWVIEESCRQLSFWKQQFQTVPDLSVNINLSSKQILDVSLVDRIRNLLSLYNLSVNDIKIELTENIIMDDSPASIMILGQLKELGVEIYIDDFGTGYSSLSYLHKFPVDALKIDRSFIAEIDAKSEESIGFSVTQSIIGLAHNLGVKVVAEGIENVRHLIYLRASGCDYGQGYLFSKPLTVEEATHLVENGLTWQWKC